MIRPLLIILIIVSSAFAQVTFVYNPADGDSSVNRGIDITIDIMAYDASYNLRRTTITLSGDTILANDVAKLGSVTILYESAIVDCVECDSMSKSIEYDKTLRLLPWFHYTMITYQVYYDGESESAVRDTIQFWTDTNVPKFLGSIPDSADTNVSASQTIKWCIQRDDSLSMSAYNVRVGGNWVVQSGAINSYWTVTDRRTGINDPLMRAMDTLSITRKSALLAPAHRYWVVATFDYDTVIGAGVTKVSCADSFWFETAYDSMLTIIQGSPVTVGTSSSPIVTVRGIRSAGMTVYSDEAAGAIVTPESYEAYPESLHTFYPSFTVNWILGNNYGIIDSCKIWGMSKDSAYTDTTTVYKAYIYQSHGYQRW